MKGAGERCWHCCPHIIISLNPGFRRGKRMSFIIMIFFFLCASLPSYDLLENQPHGRPHCCCSFEFWLSTQLQGESVYLFSRLNVFLPCGRQTRRVFADLAESGSKITSLYDTESRNSVWPGRGLTAAATCWLSAHSQNGMLMLFRFDSLIGFSWLQSELKRYIPLVSSKQCDKSLKNVCFGFRKRSPPVLIFGLRLLKRLNCWVCIIYYIKSPSTQFN